MADRHLEAWGVGTATAAVLVVGVVLASHVADRLAAVLAAIGTPAATVLFCYLWLLAVVAAGVVPPSDRRRIGGRAWLGRSVVAGGGVALAYVTIVIVLGFVSPLPTPVEPGFGSVFGAVAVGTAIGAATAPVLGGFALFCARLGSAFAPTADG